jgi:uncharacterized protein
MLFVDPHIHMVSRVTDDYERMAVAGCIAVSEPAFWPGFDRSSPKAFMDYFRQLTVVEPARAALYGIRHFTWICMNPKEADDLALSDEVIRLIPEFLNKPNVVGVGEIGLNRITRNEIKTFQKQVELALKFDQIIMVHTPHLEDKWKGTRIILDLLKEMNVSNERVLIDHIEEHTARMVLDQGYWGGITLYPFSKCSIPRAIDIAERFGCERLMVNSGGDWGPSDPLSVPKFRLEMRLRGHSLKKIQKITYDNPVQFMSQSAKFDLRLE